MNNLPLYPRGHDGRYFSFRAGCPVCGDKVVCDGVEYGRAHFHCTGLVDPNDENKPLEACDFQYFDGDPWPEGGDHG